MLTPSRVTSRHWMRGGFFGELESFELRDGATAVPVSQPWDHSSQIVMRDKFDMDRVFIVCCGPAAPYPLPMTQRVVHPAGAGCWCPSLFTPAPDCPAHRHAYDRMIRDGLAS